MKILGIVAFIAGLLLAVRVMFFGVQKKLGEDRVALRPWPFALAAFLTIFGAVIYVRAARGAPPSIASVTGAAGAALLAAVLAWWIVRRSAAIPSTDPEDDPEFRFQGQVARVVEDIQQRSGGPDTGRIAFEFDGKRYEFRARWTPGDWQSDLGRAENEVVIERVDGDVAYVEPWVAIEERL